MAPLGTSRESLAWQRKRLISIDGIARPGRLMPTHDGTRYTLAWRLQNFLGFPVDEPLRKAASCVSRLGGHNMLWNLTGTAFEHLRPFRKERVVHARNYMHGTGAVVSSLGCTECRPD